MANLLIAFREGLEAALIVGIVFGFLTRTGRANQRPMAWLGVGAAVLVSAGFALILQLIGAELEGRAEEIFEGVTMLISAIVVTGMVFWMQRNARALKHDLEAHLGIGNSAKAVALVTFTAVAREGIETALLLSTAAFSTDGPTALIGSLVGLLAAIILGYLIYATSIRVNLRTFFSVTSVMLLLFAAGLLARSVHEFQEAGVLMSLNEHLWDTSAILSETSTVGQFAKTLFGYLSSPSIESVLVYIGYLAAIAAGLRWFNARIPVLATKQTRAA